MNILGVIPARGGSKGLPRKNLLKIGNKTLIQRAIESANKSKMITRIIFSSDDDELIEEARKFNVEIPFKRPKELAQDRSSTFSVVKHLLEWLKAEQNWQPEIIVILQPTTPFRKAAHIDDTINLLLNTRSNAAITLRKPDYPPHWMMELKSESKVDLLIKNGNKFMRRQDTPAVYQPAGLVYAFKKNVIHEIKTLFPFKDTRGLIVDEHESINIDTHKDYLLANAIWELNNKK